MKLHCGAAEPKIDKAVELLQTWEVTASDRYNNAIGENARKPPQKAADIVKETRLLDLRGMLKSNEISFNDYKKRILEMHQSVPKKNTQKSLKILILLIHHQFQRILIRAIKIQKYRRPK